jgi:hypothetical protein
MQAARNVLFNGLGRDTQAVRNLLVGTLVKYPQRKGRTALWRQPIDRLVDEPIAFRESSKSPSLPLSIVRR